MGMNAFELFGVLKLDSSAFESGLKKAGTLASSAGSTIGNGLLSVAKVGAQAFTVAASAITAFGAAAVATGTKFDQAMGTVAATMGTTVDAMSENIGEVDTQYGHFSGTLREFAQFMGENTTFSATQAAQALNYMALAGYDAQKSMNMLPSVLAMAAAGSMELAQASDMVTDAQMALGISEGRTMQMVDEFAKAASSGNTSVEQLGEAMLRVGALGRELNGGFVTLSDGTQVAVDNIQELEIAFTAMANRGIKGTEAGTHMRNMLLKLSNPTKDGANALENLGVAIFDAEGNMRGLSEIFGDLSTALDSVSQQERLQVVADLFNTRDMASAEGLLAAISEDWNKIGEAVLQADGASDQMSKTKLNNLAGDMTLFKSALESAQIAVNDKLSPTLREFVQLGTKGIQSVSKAFKSGGLEGAMEAFGEWLSEALNMIIEKMPDIIQAGSKLLSALGKGLLDNLDVIITAGITIVETIGQSIINAMPVIIDAGLQILEAMLTVIDENLDSIISAVGQLISGIGTALQEHSSTIFALVQSIMSQLFGVFMANLPMMLEMGAQLLSELANGIATSLPTLIPSIVDIIKEIVSVLIENLPELISATVDIIMAIGNGLIANLPLLVSASIEILMQIVQALIENLPLILNAAIELTMALADGLLQSIPILIAAIPPLVAQLVQAIIDNLPMLIDGLIRLVLMIVDNLPTIIIALIKAIPQIIASLITGLLAALPQLVAGCVTLVVELVKHLPEIIMALVKAIPEIIKTIIGAFGPVVAGLGNLFKSAWEGIKNVFSNVGGWFKDKFAAAKENAVNAWSNVKEKFSGVWSKIKEGFKFGDALQWGKDMIQNFINGVTSMVNKVKDAVSGVANKIKGFLGFSEPEYGPLSNFHTFAPDMMQLFVKGIKDNENLLYNQIKDTFDFGDMMTTFGNIPITDVSIGYSRDDRIISLLEQLVNKENVIIEGDADKLFNIMRRKSYDYRRATGNYA